MLGPAVGIVELGLKAMFLFALFIPSALAALGSSTLFRAVVARDSRLDDWAPDRWRMCRRFSNKKSLDGPWAAADWSARALFRVFQPRAAAVAVRGAGSAGGLYVADAS